VIAINYLFIRVSRVRGLDQYSEYARMDAGHSPKRYAQRSRFSYAMPKDPDNRNLVPVRIKCSRSAKAGTTVHFHTFAPTPDRIGACRPCIYQNKT
jgi:hypothetical protein